MRPRRVFDGQAVSAPSRRRPAFLCLDSPPWSRETTAVIALSCLESNIVILDTLCMLAVANYKSPVIQTTCVNTMCNICKYYKVLGRCETAVPAVVPMYGYSGSIAASGDAAKPAV